MLQCVQWDLTSNLDKNMNIIHSELLVESRKNGYSIPILIIYKALYIISSLFVFYGYGMLLYLFLEVDYISNFIYEQLILIIILMYHFLNNNNKSLVRFQYVLRSNKDKFAKTQLIKEILSLKNFIILPLTYPLLIQANDIVIITQSPLSLIIRLYAIGLFINLLIKIAKHLFNKNLVGYIIINILLLVYGTMLIIFYNTSINFSILNIQNEVYSFMMLILVLLVLIFYYNYSLKKERYLLYENNGIIREIPLYDLGSKVNLNLWNNLFIFQLLRCKEMKKFVLSILINLVVGVFLFFILDFKLLGLSLFIGGYTLHIIQFTIYLNSDYFEALYTRPFSIKKLLLNYFYANFITTSLLFGFVLTYLIISNQFVHILSSISIYFCMLGPIAFILMCNILYAKRYQLYPTHVDFSIRRTFTQKTIGFIAGFTLFISFIVISLLPLGVYFVIGLGVLFFSTHQYWITLLYSKFMHNKYQIIKNLRE